MLSNPVDGVKRPMANGNKGSTPALGDAQARRLLEAPGVNPRLATVRARVTLPLCRHERADHVAVDRALARDYLAPAARTDADFVRARLQRKQSRGQGRAEDEATGGFAHIVTVRLTATAS
jgi:hypothetical protein